MIETLGQIWKRNIKRDYQEGTIINEATLQAALYHHLRSVSSHEKEVHVVAEVTRFLGEDTRKGIPDLVICDPDKRTVEIVMELKLDPGRLRYEQDIRKLARWAAKVQAQPRHEIRDVFTVNPGTLCWTDYKNDENDNSIWYRLSAKTHWVFGGIGTSKNNNNGAFSIPALRKAAGRKKNIPWERFWLFAGEAPGESSKIETEFTVTPFSDGR